MTMRGAIRLGLAGALGATCALLVACGSSGKGLIPSTNAGPLSSDFDSVSQAVSAGDCAATQRALDQARRDFNALPAGIDAGLRANLRQGLTNLEQIAPTECARTQSQSQTSQTTSSQTSSTTTSSTTSTTPTTSTTTTSTTTTPTTTSSTTSSSSSTTTPTTGPATGGGTPAPSGNGSGGAGAGQ